MMEGSKAHDAGGKALGVVWGASSAKHSAILPKASVAFPRVCIYAYKGGRYALGSFRDPVNSLASRIYIAYCGKSYPSSAGCCPDRAGHQPGFWAPERNLIRLFSLIVDPKRKALTKW